MSWQSDYNRITMQARQEMIGSQSGIPQSAVRLLSRYLAQALSDIEKGAGTGILTDERAKSLKRQILESFARMTMNIEKGMDQQTRRAISLAIKGHQSALSSVSRSVGIQAPANFDRVPIEALSVLATRRGLAPEQTLRTLIRRNIAGLQPQLDSLLSSAVARGIPAGRTTIELAALMSQNQSPFFQRALSNASEGKIHANLINEALEEMPASYSTEFSKLKSLLYDSRRIVVSEINNTYAEADRIASAQSPVVDLLKWEVSGRHFEIRTTPDVCTMYYEQDLQGHGPGVYTPRTIPGLPHAFCGCFTSKVFRSPSKWTEPKRAESRSRRLTFSEMRNKYSQETDNFIRRQVDTANQMNDLAWQSYQSTL